MRLIAGLVLALAFFSGMAPSIGAQENGLASITIYNSLCPVDYSGTNYYQDCYPTPAPAGREFTLTNTGTSEESTKTTGSNGFLAFEGIDEDGEFLLSSGPGFLICSEDGNPFPVTGTQNGFLLDLTTDNDIRCDWFTFRFSDDGNGLASVTIRKAFCPVGYTGSNFFDDCYGDPGENITFTLTNDDIGFSEEATTGADGFTAFEGIDTDGTYLLGEEIPGDFNDIFVDCSKGGEDFPITDDGNFATLNLTTADDIRCDWYNIPEDAVGDPGSLTVYKIACPAGYTGTNYFRDCFNNPQANIPFTIFQLGGDFAASGMTDANGFVSFTLPALGRLSLSEPSAPTGDKPPFVVFCTKNGGSETIQVDYNSAQRDPGGGTFWFVSFPIEFGDQIRCDWYNLPPAAPSPSPSPQPTQPVTQLPNTGAGVNDSGSGSTLPLGFGLLGLAGVSLVFAVNHRARRKGA